MKKILVLLMLILPVCAWAESGSISYLEGEVTHKSRSGETSQAAMGKPVATGDTIITGKNGLCELTLDNGSTIRINSGTVFALTEREDAEEKGKKRSVFSTIIGMVTCKFKKFTGKEPYIATPTTACGVRGTEFTIVAGADGSALYVLDSGAIAVSAQGNEVLLAPEEGVKVQAGQKPGRKFEVKKGTLDFSKALEESEEAMRANPSKTLKDLWGQIREFEKESDAWKTRQQNLMAQVKKLREEITQKRESMEEKEWKELYGETVAPLEQDISLMSLNSRYYVVGTQSIRRHLISAIYVHMRTKHVMNTDSGEWRSFKKDYDSFLEYYNEEYIKTGYTLERDI